MTRIWIVARWEFLATVARAGFIVTVLALPAVHLGLGWLLATSVRTAAEPAGQKPVAVVDRAGLLRDAPAGRDVIVRDEAEALRTLAKGGFEAVFVLDDHYLETGGMQAFTMRASGLFGFADALARRERAASVVRHGLLGPVVPAAVAARVADPASNVVSFRIDREGRRLPDPVTPLGALSGVFGLCLLLSLAIFMSSGLLQQAMTVERQNRVLEVVLALIRPSTLLIGKVLGLSAAGLLQVGVYLTLVIGPAPAMLGMSALPAATIGAAFACFAAGFVFYACLLAATGALGRDTQESAQIATTWILIGAAPLFLLGSISAHPSSTVAHVLSWIPLTSPTALLLRIGADGVSTFELAGALLMTIVFAGVTLAISAALLLRTSISGGSLQPGAFFARKARPDR